MNLDPYIVLSPMMSCTPERMGNKLAPSPDSESTLEEEPSYLDNDEMALNLSPCADTTTTTTTATATLNNSGGAAAFLNSNFDSFRDEHFSPMSISSPLRFPKQNISFPPPTNLFSRQSNNDLHQSQYFLPTSTRNTATAANNERSFESTNHHIAPPRYPLKSSSKFSHWNTRSFSCMVNPTVATATASSKENNVVDLAKSPPSSPCKPKRYGKLAAGRVNVNLSKIRRTQSQCYSEEAFLNPQTVEKPLSSGAPNGERSSLPYLECGKADALRRVSPDTIVKLMNHEFDSLIDKYYIIDCRFPYEYEGGHIVGAININSMEELEVMFLDRPPNNEKVAVIFHCEFSSHRAPRMALHLRREDRKRNVSRYPFLYYPEIYIVQGGYRNFFAEHKEHCFPQQYIEMKDESYKLECRKEMTSFKKSWKRSKSFSDAGSSFSDFKVQTCNFVSPSGRKVTVDQTELEIADDDDEYNFEDEEDDNL